MCSSNLRFPYWSPKRCLFTLTGSRVTDRHILTDGRASSGSGERNTSRRFCLSSRLKLASWDEGRGAKGGRGGRREGPEWRQPRHSKRKSLTRQSLELADAHTAIQSGRQSAPSGVTATVAISAVTPLVHCQSTVNAIRRHVASGGLFSSCSSHSSSMQESRACQASRLYGAVLPAGGWQIKRETTHDNNDDDEAVVDTGITGDERHR